MAIFLISFAGFYYLGKDKILTKTVVIIFLPAIIIAVTVTHYFFWNSATGVSKPPDKRDISNLSC